MSPAHVVVNESQAPSLAVEGKKVLLQIVQILFFLPYILVDLAHVDQSVESDSCEVEVGESSDLSLLNLFLQSLSPLTEVALSSDFVDYFSGVLIKAV